MKKSIILVIFCSVILGCEPDKTPNEECIEWIKIHKYPFSITSCGFFNDISLDHCVTIVDAEGKTANFEPVIIDINDIIKKKHELDILLYSNI